MNDEFVLIDTSIIDEVISKREHLVSEYDAINTEYERIVRELMNNWKGKGADAFRYDADKVKTNIAGIYDILKIMCDTLEDCKAIIAEADTALGNYNSEVGETCQTTT